MASGDRSRRYERDDRYSSSRSRSGGSGGGRTGGSSSGRNRSGSSATQRRRQRERQARRRRMILLVAVVVIVIGVILAFLAVTGEIGTTDYTSSTAEFMSDGSIRVTTVESFDQSYYDEDELKELINEEISAYGSGVKKESLEIADGSAVLVLTYDSAEDYVSFNETDLFIGTVEEAETAGYDFQSIMSAVSQEDTTKILNQATLDQLPENQVIILCEEVDVVTYTGILYATSNLGVTDETHASVIDTISEETPAIIILKSE